MANFTTAVNGKYSSVILSARMDFSTYIEASGKLPIVAAENQKLLEQLCQEQNLTIDYLVDGEMAHVYRNLNLNDENGFSYSQVWVKANFEQYREPWAAHHCKRDNIKRADMSTLHADHVVNKKSLLN